ncbi:MAG: ABC transporter permease [Candidatus Thermofonsia Clade 1 bacterium]|jgi:multiple sugar transport system permease protein|uniref:ABC transporter permease n=1 Tax=Candidatus Thermofonsia Clade 1 bacterium TaxID=2364210 RepID=A0A2M8PBH4_9CHLR|nr:MAG: ABC transporter permease [Candidatus Thermofonsia Clade 1 bacterium]RMF49244.1 MAG: carbohydrate ABC transporter permease [Chloroflexota bacterium]
MAQAQNLQTNLLAQQARAIARRRSRIPASAWLQLVLLLLLLLFILTPFYWMVSTSLKEQNDTFAIPPKILFTPTLEHYNFVLFSPSAIVPTGLQNSLIVATFTTLLALLLGTPAAYILARFEFRGKRDLWFWFISNRFISPIVVALPFFLIARDLRMLNTPQALILIYLTFNIPLVVWLCLDQFRAIPRDLDEQAKVDGCNLFQSFWRINLPLAIPGVVVSAILCFIFSWNELLFALILNRSTGQTAPVQAANFMTGFGVKWGEMMATGTLIVLPVVLFAAIVSRHLARGLTMGAIK